MYLNVSPRANNRKYLSIVHGYRDKDGKVKKKTIKSIGYLDELEKDYADPIAHFTALAKQMDEERLEAAKPLMVNISAKMDNNVRPKNFGYSVLSSIYHELGIHTFLINHQRHSKETYDANAIMKMLVFLRMLKPGSKKFSYENRDILFENTDYSLDDVYRCLGFLDKHKEALKKWLNDRIKENYGRDTSLIYYDVTNYYFETDNMDDFKRRGVSKEHRPNPIIQMGLCMDNNGIPITYNLFPGNTSDCLTYRPALAEIKKDFDLGRIITVADKGMTTGDNIWYTINTPSEDGYVFSMSVRNADKEIRNFVLNDAGYEWFGDEYKRKSRLYPRTIQVTTATGKKMKKTADEKQVVFYSDKYARRTRAERAITLEKAKDLVKHPSKYTSATSYGAAKYVKKIEYDKETGEIIKSASILDIDEERIKEEEALDGYYLLVTSEMEESDDRIIDIYRGLWKIEESFKITKSELEARPVYVSTREHIEAHFLTCFVALIITRLLEMKTEHKYSTRCLLESLANCNCSLLEQNYYHMTYNDEVLTALGQAFSIDFSQKYRKLSDIKKNLAKTKKQK